MSDRNDMMEMAERSSQIIDALCAAMLNTASVAAEKINTASDLAAMRMRMEAASGALEMISAQKQPIVERMNAEPEGSAMRLLLGRQLEILVEREMAVLEKASVPKTVAKQVLGKVDKVYQRDGRRFAGFAPLFPILPVRASISSQNLELRGKCAQSRWRSPNRKGR